jgi:DNA-directed RNA polymerase subunit RPC12/RpoP
VAVLGALVTIGGLAYLVGSALLWVSYWRIWRSLQTHERNLGYAEIRPAVMLALWAGGLLAVGVMPWLGWAVQLAAGSYVLYRTQRGLNRVWTGAAGGYRATPPSSPLTPMAPVDPGPDPRPPTPSAGQPPPLRAGETDIQPPSVEPPLHEEAPAFVCSACGNREPLVDGRRGGVRCPRCGDPSLVPEFGT